MRTTLALAILAGVLAAPLAATSAQVSAPSGASVADTSPFRALDLPTPNEYRTGSGRPGPRYWQQRADTWALVAASGAASTPARIARASVVRIVLVIV